MIAKTPVLPGFETLMKETVYAEDQPQYNPLPSLKVPGPEGEVITRWELTDEEKVKLLSGAHIYLSIWTFGQPLQPIRLQVATAKDIVDEPRNVVIVKESPVIPDVTAEEGKPS